MRILVLHGINLNMFGKREASIYGTTTLAEIDASLMALAQQLGVGLECMQTNSEGAICERIHQASSRRTCRAVLINAGAWTHYSYGLRDALAMLTVPIVEVAHVEHPCARAFRTHSVIAPIAQGPDLRVRRRQLPARAARGRLADSAKSPTA